MEEYSDGKDSPFFSFVDELGIFLRLQPIRRRLQECCISSVDSEKNRYLCGRFLET